MQGPIVITGGAGFVGRWLRDALQVRQPDVDVISWSAREPGTSGEPPMNSLTIDITDPRAVNEAICAYLPRTIVHLAGITSIAEVQKDQTKAWAVNVGGTRILGEAVLSHVPSCRFIYVSSSEVYGRSFQASSHAVNENAALLPLNAYAESKAAAERSVRKLMDLGLQGLCFRPFNHTGPAQDERFVIPSFAAQIARIEGGQQKPVISVGNLESARDFLDVRDVVQAYVKAIVLQDLPPSRVFNLASGVPRTIADALQQLLALTDVRIEVKADPGRMRPSDIPVAFGDASRARDELQWEPQIPWAQTLRDILETFRLRYARCVP